MENPASECGRRDMVLPLQMLSKATVDRNSNHAAERLSASTIYCQARGLVAREAFASRQGGRSVTSHHPPCCQQALIQPGTGLCVWPQFRTRPFPFPLDFLSHSLRLTGKQQEGKTRIRLRNSMSGPGLPWETQLLTQESVNRWLKMSVINNFLFKKYQVKCKL